MIQNKFKYSIQNLNVKLTGETEELKLALEQSKVGKTGEMGEELKALRDECDTLATANETLTVINQNLESDNAAFVSKISEVKTENAELRLAATKAEGEDSLLVDERTKNEELQAEVEKLKGLKKNLVAQLDLSKQSYISLTLQLGEAKDANAEIQDKVDDLQEQNIELRHKVAEQKETIEELSEKVTLFTTENGEAGEVVSNMTADLERVKAENKDLVDEREKLLLEVDNFKRDCAELDENWKMEIEKLTTENEQLRNASNGSVTAGATEQELKNLAYENAALANSYDELHRKYSELHVENSKIRDEINDSVNQCKALESERDTLAAENEELDRIVRDFRADAEVAEGENCALEAARENLELENAALKARLLKSVNAGLNSTPKQVEESENSRQKVELLSAENEKLLKNNLNLASEMQKISEENDTLIDENQVLKKYLDDINLLSSQLYTYTRIDAK